MNTNEQSGAPLDILAARLWQAHGSLLAILNTYDDEHNEFSLPAGHMRHAIDAAVELVGQARDALDEMITVEALAKRNAHRSTT